MPKTKLVITGDWHIRIKPDIPEAWQINRYHLLFDEVIRICLEHGARLVLSGDILDRNRPSLVELQLVTRFLNRCDVNNLTTYLISGNHESLGLGTSTYDYLSPFLSKLEYVHYNPSNEIFVPLENDVDLYLVGHPALPSYEAGDLRTDKTNILVSHFRCTVNQFIQEELDVAKFIEPFDTCYASDIHMPLDLYDGKLKYTNHPLNSCFEAKAECGLLLVEANGAGLKDTRIKLSLPNLVQVTTTAADYEDTLDDVDYYRIEVKGSPDELRSITTASANTKLLKVPDVVSEYVAETETEEINNVGLEDSLLGYLTEMQVPEETITKMMKIYQEA